MKKMIRWLGIFAVIGTAVGLAVAYFMKNDSDIPAEKDADFTEDEDFDLDADLQPAHAREYVSLKKDAKESSDTPSDDSRQTE